MKNLLICLVILVSMASGTSNAKETTIVKDTDECINVTLSCGVSGCVYVTSMEMLLIHIAYAEAYWCEEN